MIYLTDEQFEDLMQGKDVSFAHLKECLECRGRLSEKQALASRLQLPQKFRNNLFPDISQ